MHDLKHIIYIGLGAIPGLRYPLGGLRLYSPTDMGEATILQKVNVVDASKMSPAQSGRR